MGKKAGREKREKTVRQKYYHTEAKMAAERGRACLLRH